MANTNLAAEPRSETGKGVARKLRAAGRIPAVVYGHNRAAESITVDARELERLLGRISAASTVVELGLGGGTARTLIREIQRHPVRRHILHVDFQELVAGEKVTVNVPLVFVGTAIGVREQGGIFEEVMREISISVDPASIPNHVDVDISKLTIGHPLHVRDLQLPAGVTVLDDADATVCSVAGSKAAASEETTAASPAEPEVIRQKKAEE
ncbi:50S ribosomal protein L25/general stress protein Ctc [Roseisolibacter agri]|uniref:Large ribosomal subunit protein bL25 n=1 Tax=Roseisolibacter agri TaxID=2014610 RepID=A0AA37V1K2_9BACT|nr:50S ribosomal protein L25/general stress protein Ctc [Roseisolibacter agri]GLC26365.1 50S ribosomal protein L25 [Roseisolibacter agri]